ncbi:hypothetical protein Lal_00015668 [Lupinus albus]|nr:hypothetical protein Lal_00015668 [Lupinus albus]
MEQSRPKRVKTSATRVRRREVGSPSTRDRGDPYYSLILQETRMAKFHGQKPTYIRYVDLTWLAEQNFSFPHDMEAQGTIQFMELKGQVYPALVREFYANFRYKDGKYWSMISGNLFELNDEIFMNVGGLSSSGYSIGDCSWVKENFDPTEVYKSFLRGPHLYIQGQLTKAGSLSVENRLLHHIIAYILLQRNTNHAQPTVNDLRFWIYLMMIIRMTQLEAMEQRLNNLMDLHFQGLKDSYFAGMEQYEERQTAYSDNQFRELRNLIQSTAEAQNALFCSEFQKLSVLIRGDQNIVISADHTDDPHPPPQP